jgi:hypothetical protein
LTEAPPIHSGLRRLLFRRFWQGAPGSSRPAKRCRACAIFSRPLAAVAITSTWWRTSGSDHALATDRPARRPGLPTLDTFAAFEKENVGRDIDTYYTMMHFTDRGGAIAARSIAAALAPSREWRSTKDGSAHEVRLQGVGDAMFMGFHQAAIQAGKISIAVFPASGQLLDPPVGITVLHRRSGRAA